MGLFKKFRRRVGSGPDSFSAGVTSVSEDSWEAALTGILPTDASKTDLISFIISGQPQPQPHRFYGQSAQGAGPQFSHNFRAFRQLFERHPRTILAVAVSLTIDQRERFGQLLNCQWTLSSVLQCAMHTDNEKDSRSAGVSLQELEEAGAALGWAPDELSNAVVETQRWSSGISLLGYFPGIDELVERELGRLAGVLTPARNDHQPIWRRLADVQPDTLQLLAPQICDAVTGSAKALRNQCLPLFERLPQDVAIEQLKLLATTAKPAKRASAITLLASLVSEEQLPDFQTWVQDNLADDRSKAVQDAVAALDKRPEPELERPPLPEVDLPSVKAPKVKLDQWRTHDPVKGLEAIANGKKASRKHGSVLATARWLTEQHPNALDGWSPGHIARLLLEQSNYLTYQADLATSWLRTTACPTPLEISAVAAHDGRGDLAPVQVVTHLFAADDRLWTAEEISRWAAYEADGLKNAFEDRASNYSFDRASLFTTLAVVDPMPPGLQTTLITAAVAGYRADRTALYDLVGIEHLDAVLPYLKARKRGERLGAAEWLKAHPSRASVPDLLAATRKEADDGLKSALLASLEIVGQPLDEFLSPESLLADATKALSKKSTVPKAMSWLNVDVLPQLHWADGSPVAKEIVQWFLALAVKAKTAEPSPILRRHFSNMERSQVRAFGTTLLDLWLAEDLAPLGHDEALVRAKQAAAHTHQYAQNPAYASYYSEYQNMSLQQVTDKLYSGFRQTVAGSATGSKGLLAVVAASAGPEVTDNVLAYVRKHRGNRVSQAKSMLQMLAWIDEPATVQAVMSIATRFRPKGIQDEALNQAKLLAERRGWTLDDLADRSVPTAGFESNGRQVFNYGDRTFTAHLGDDLTISLTNDETGKTVRSLPKGRADEDETLIKDAKKDFTAAKKELKSALKLQPDRLQLAMCVQREWTVDDFSRYFLGHPLMIRLVTRLVWTAVRPNGETVAFRPLTDGTILGVDDDEVELDEAMSVSIAHQHVVGEQASAAWLAHLADYEIVPLFGQFGRPQVTFEKKQTIIADYNGYKHNDGTLRGQMNRHAWELGIPQDAGIVGELVKRVPTAELTAVISLGEGIPAGAYDVGSWPTSVGTLFFVPAKASYYEPRDAIPLNQVPPVLLTEFHAEYEAIATSGTPPDGTGRVST